MSKPRKGDISKQLYKFQEGISAIALELSGLPQEQVLWPPMGRPAGLSVDVDVLVGNSPESAKINISVKHATSAKESEKGGWRMLREIFESKASCQDVRIYNVLFDKLLKNHWLYILESFFDGFVILPDEAEYGPTLVRKAYEYTRGPLARVEDSRVRSLLREAVTVGSSTYDPELYSATRQYGQRLATLLNERKPELESLWKAIRSDYFRPIPNISPRTTSLKRGLAKLLIFTPEERHSIYHWLITGAPIPELGKYALDLGLAEEDIAGGWSVIDVDIPRALRLLGSDAPKLAEWIFSQSPVERMEQLYIHPLRNAHNVSVYFQYLCDHLNELRNSADLSQRLIECFRDPTALLDGYEIDQIEDTVWLYKTVVSVLKAHGGTRQSSGYASISERIEDTQGVSSGYITLSDFVNRKASISIGPEVEDLVTRVADVLSDALHRIDQKEIEQVRTSVKEYYVQTLLEAQLIPYRAFDPIGVLFKERLRKASLNFVEHGSFSTCAKEYAGTARGGTTKALEVQSQKPCIVLWQSPNKNAQDKAKEFAARIAAIRWRYDSEHRRFVSRGYQVRMILDGIWDESDIRALLRFGAEAVYYPDQLEALVADILR